MKSMGTLYIVATPIGNREDITLRAIKILQSVDVILCEDTRRTGLLVKTGARLVSYYDETEDKRIPEVISWLESGKDVALVSDAGTPLISDPGYKLVRGCIKRNIQVISIPGASAILAALTSSGLPPTPFHFYGFLPEKQNARRKLLEQCKDTCIFFCAPHKLQTTLSDMRDVFGDIDIVIARELTKIHEELWHGNISGAQNYFQNPKGEFVLLFNILQE